MLIMLNDYGVCINFYWYLIIHDNQNIKTKFSQLDDTSSFVSWFFETHIFL